MDKYDERKYSSYTVEQIMNDLSYQKICSCFFALAQNEKISYALKQILYYGGMGDYEIRSKICSKDNPSIDRNRRISMAYLLINNPSTFSYFMDHRINLFHGTNSSCLPNVLKYGLNSAKEMEKRKIPLSSGENWSQREEKRDFISFTDILDLAEDYASINAEKTFSFPVILGTTLDEMKDVSTVKVFSDLSEVGVSSPFSIEKIRCICVPSSKVSLVRKMVASDQIIVLGLSNLNQKFYHLDKDLGSIEVSLKKYQDYKNSRDHEKEEKKFTIKEVEDLAKSRSFFGMSTFFHRMKNGLVEEKGKENGRSYR